MKRGDKIPVTIGGHVVANAEVKELGDGTATLVVPATLVVMGTRTTLDDLPETPATGTETIITGVDRTPAEASATVGDNQNAQILDNSGNVNNSGNVDSSAPVEQPAATPVAPVQETTVPSPTPEPSPPSDTPGTTVEPVPGASEVAPASGGTS